MLKFYDQKQIQTQKSNYIESNIESSKQGLCRLHNNKERFTAATGSGTIIQYSIFNPDGYAWAP
jgi:hypothetical protein